MAPREHSRLRSRAARAVVSLMIVLLLLGLGSHSHAASDATTPVDVGTTSDLCGGKTGEGTLSLTLRTPEIQGKPLDIVLAVDHSASVNPDRVREAARAIIDHLGRLGRPDRVAVVAFADASTLALSMTSEPDQAFDVMDGLAFGGKTALGDGLHRALTHLRENARSDATSLLVMLTDGNRLVGRGSLPPAEQAGTDGLPIYPVCVGRACRTGLMDEIAQQSGGMAFDRLSPDALERLYRDAGRAVAARSVELSVTLPNSLDVQEAIEHPPRTQLPGRSIRQYEWRLPMLFRGEVWQTRLRVDATQTGALAAAHGEVTFIRPQGGRDAVSIPQFCAPPCQASASCSPENPVVGEEVTCEVEVQNPDCELASCKWEMGDGTTQSACEVSHAYETTGEYQLHGNLVYENGNEDSISATIGVNKADTSTTITSDKPDPSVVGEPVTVHYDVTVDAPGSGSPTGNVEVKASKSDAKDQTCNASVSTGQCTLTFRETGTWSIKAQYGGNSDFNGSTSTVESHNVNQPVTTTTITSDKPDPSVVGEPVTVRYDVTVDAPGNGSPTEPCTVTASKSGATGPTCNDSVSAGQCTLAFDGPGTWSIVAKCGGDTSEPEPHTVTTNKPPDACFRVDPQPALIGEAVTLDASCSSDPDGSIARYVWTLPGEKTIEQEQPTLAYPFMSLAPSVALKVVDEQGASDRTDQPQGEGTIDIFPGIRVGEDSVYAQELADPTWPDWVTYFYDDGVVTEVEVQEAELRCGKLYVPGTLHRLTCEAAEAIRHLHELAKQMRIPEELATPEKAKSAGYRDLGSCVAGLGQAYLHPDYWLGDRPMLPDPEPPLRTERPPVLFYGVPGGEETVRAVGARFLTRNTDAELFLFRDWPTLGPMAYFEDGSSEALSAFSGCPNVVTPGATPLNFCRPQLAVLTVWAGVAQLDENVGDLIAPTHDNVTCPTEE